MIRQLHATMKTKDKVESGGYNRFELFAGETLILSMVSEDLAATCHLEDKDKDSAVTCHHEGQGGVREIRLSLSLLVKP